MLLEEILTACCEVSREARSWESSRRRAEGCFCSAMYSGLRGWLRDEGGRGLVCVGRVGDESIGRLCAGAGREGPGEDEIFDAAGDKTGSSVEVVVDSGVAWVLLLSAGRLCFMSTRMGDLNGLESVEVDSLSRLRFAAFMTGSMQSKAELATMM